MRLADFTEDWEAAESADQLGRALIDRRAVQQQVRLDGLVRAARRGEDLSLLMHGTRWRESERRVEPRPVDDVEPVYGSAVMQVEGRMRAVLLVDERAVRDVADRGQLLPAADVPALRSLVRSLPEEQGVKPPADLLVLPMPELIPYFAPGEQTNGPGTTGTFGALATDGQGNDCVLTAGHVAPTGAQVTDPTGATGTVTWSNDPAAVAGPGPGADVAVVVPDGSTAQGGVPISSAAIARPGDLLDVRGAFTPAGATQTMLFTLAVYVPRMTGMWAEVYLTTDAASQPGDSGAAVLRSGTDEIVGHIVGGAPGVTSTVQAIDLQLRAAGCTLRPSP